MYLLHQETTCPFSSMLMNSSVFRIRRWNTCLLRASLSGWFVAYSWCHPLDTRMAANMDLGSSIPNIMLDISTGKLPMTSKLSGSTVSESVISEVLLQKHNTLLMIKLQQAAIVTHKVLISSDARFIVNILQCNFRLNSWSLLTHLPSTLHIYSPTILFPYWLYNVQPIGYGDLLMRNELWLADWNSKEILLSHWLYTLVQIRNSIILIRNLLRLSNWSFLTNTAFSLATPILKTEKSDHTHQ